MSSQRLGLHRNWSSIHLLVRLLPIIFFQLYLWLTTILFVYGPWPWPVENPLELYSFLFAAHFSLGLGYLSGFIGKSSVAGSNKSDFKTLVSFSIILSVILYLPTVYSRTGFFVPDIYYGVTNAGDAYANAVDLSISGGEFVYVEYVRILVAPITALAVPVIMINWGVWSKGYRLMAVVLMISSVALYMAMGTNKAVADLAITLPWLILLGYFSRGIRITKTGWFRVVSVCFILLIVVGVFFSIGQAQRSGSGVVTGSFGSPLYILTNRDQLYFEVLPTPLAVFYEAITRYICQGYYALSLALKFPFDSTYGFGHSMFLLGNVVNINGLEGLMAHSYPARLEVYHGWGMYELWHSGYVWIASDVGFFGALLVVFFIGRWLCLSWRDVITVRDPRASVAFYFLVVALFYIPANNQVMQNGETFFAFYCTLVWWLLRRNGIVLWKRRTVHRKTDRNGSEE